MIMWQPENVGTVHSTDLWWPLHKWQVTSLNQPWGDLRLPGGLEPPRPCGSSSAASSETVTHGQSRLGKRGTHLWSPRWGSEGYFISSLPCILLLLLPPGLWVSSFYTLHTLSSFCSPVQIYSQVSSLHGQKWAAEKQPGNCPAPEKHRLRNY